MPDRTVPSGTLAHAQAHLFPIAFESHIGKLGFNPIISNHSIVYLGLATTPGSLGGGPATLTQGGGQNCDFCDCVGTRHSFPSNFLGIVKVYIFVGTALFPRRRIYSSHLRSSWCAGLKTRNPDSMRHVHVSLLLYLILLT